MKQRGVVRNNDEAQDIKIVSMFFSGRNRKR